MTQMKALLAAEFAKHPLPVPTAASSFLPKTLNRAYLPLMEQILWIGSFRRNNSLNLPTPTHHNA